MSGKLAKKCYICKSVRHSADSSQETQERNRLLGVYKD